MKIAVSACLLGTPCRFDGASKPCDAVLALRELHELIPVCPEVAGGLPVPHEPCEIVADRAELRVIDATGIDRTGAFEQGARATLDLVQAEGCELAVLKAKSPSCGTGRIYDGTFTGTLVPGDGVAARMLAEAGVRVINERQCALEFGSPHFLYVLECADGSWYTGYATNVEERIKTHNAGMGAKYTRARLPVSLVAQAAFATKHEAMSAEYRFKQLSRTQKEALVRRAADEPFADVLREALNLGAGSLGV